jgi:apolipoprotein D and lipocalin family protein
MKKLQTLITVGNSCQVRVWPAPYTRPLVALWLLLGCGFTMTSCARTPETTKRPIVKTVDLQRYAGTWYEIARFPHRFEKDLVGVTATYNLKDNNRIEVINQGYLFTLDGVLKRAVGKAKVPDPAVPGHLRVSFFWIFYADYFILELDQANYQYALIGSSSDKYLWILSRTPSLDDMVYNNLVQKARQLGYDVSLLEKVPQRL